MTDLFGSEPPYFADAQRNRLRIIKRLKASGSASQNGSASGSANAVIDSCIPVTFNTPSTSKPLYPIRAVTHSVTQTPSVGIDTMRIWTENYEVTEPQLLSGAEAVERTDLDTGEMRTEAKMNGGRFSLAIYEDAMVVTASLPRLIRSTNAVGATGSDVLKAVQNLQRLLSEHGVTTDLRKAKVSRLDLCVTANLPAPLADYDAALSRLEFPHMQMQTYGNGNRTWQNRQRSITLYDKSKESGSASGTLTRLEYRLKRADAVRRHTGLETVHELLTQPEAVRTAYISAVERLFNIPAGPDADTDTKPDAFRAVLKAVAEEQSRSVPSTAMMTYAVAEASDGFLKAVERIVEEERGRQAAYRFRKKLKRLQGYADAYRDATDTVADRVAELRKAFL